MTKYIRFSFLLFCCCMAAACNTTTPEQYFDVAVLNANLISGFAGNMQLSELESPSVKLSASNEQVAMKRKEVIESKIKFLEENFGKLKSLKETTDTKEIIQCSRAIYEYILPVYKADYLQLARLYDDGASKEQIKSKAVLIHDTWFPGYEALFTKLISAGKLYATRHSIQVNWRM